MISTPGKSRYALVCQGLLRVLHLRCMLLMANVKLLRSFCQCEAAGFLTPTPLRGTSPCRGRIGNVRGSRASGLQGFRITGFQDFRVSGFQGDRPNYLVPDYLIPNTYYLTPDYLIPDFLSTFSPYFSILPSHFSIVFIPPFIIALCHFHFI